MKRAAQIFAVLNMTVIGISHLIRPRACFTFAAIGLYNFHKISLERANLICAAGIGFLCLSALLLAHVVTAK